MFLFLLSLFSSFVLADTPIETMEVVGSRYDDIYIDKPVVMQDGNIVKKYDYSPILMSIMGQHHRTFYRSGEIGGIYNDETIKLYDNSCDFRNNSLKCGKENDVWILKSTIQITRNQAYIALFLYDENTTLIGTASVSKKLRRKIIPRRIIEKEK